MSTKSPGSATLLTGSETAYYPRCADRHTFTRQVPRDRHLGRASRSTTGYFDLRAAHKELGRSRNMQSNLLHPHKVLSNECRMKSYSCGDKAGQMHTSPEGISDGIFTVNTFLLRVSKPNGLNVAPHSATYSNFEPDL